MTIIDALLGEHGVIYALFDRLEGVLDELVDLVVLREQATLLAAALVSHAQLEDELLFEPALAAGGPEPFRAMQEEHRDIEALLDRCRVARSVGDSRSALREAIERARDHFVREEQVVFPLAGGVLDASALADLGRRWARHRRVALAT